MNPKGKIGQAMLKDCSWAECKKSGKTAKWNACPNAATEEFVEKKMEEIKLLLEQVVGNMSSPITTHPVQCGGTTANANANANASTAAGSGCESEIGIYSHFITKCIIVGVHPSHIQANYTCEKAMDGNWNTSEAWATEGYLPRSIDFFTAGPVSTNTFIFKNANVNDIEINFI